MGHNEVQDGDVPHGVQHGVPLEVDHSEAQVHDEDGGALDDELHGVGNDHGEWHDVLHGVQHEAHDGEQVGGQPLRHGVRGEQSWLRNVLNGVVQQAHGDGLRLAQEYCDKWVLAQGVQWCGKLAHEV